MRIDLVVNGALSALLQEQDRFNPASCKPCGESFAAVSELLAEQLLVSCGQQLEVTAVTCMPVETSKELAQQLLINLGRQGKIMISTGKLQPADMLIEHLITQLRELHGQWSVSSRILTQAVSWPLADSAKGDF